MMLTLQTDCSSKTQRFQDAPGLCGSQRLYAARTAWMTEFVHVCDYEHVPKAALLPCIQ